MAKKPWFPQEDNATVEAQLTAIHQYLTGLGVPGVLPYNLVRLDGSSRLPAVNGSLLTHLPSFTKHTDTPSSYSGHALKGLRVNAAMTGIEFFSGMGDVVGPASSTNDNVPQWDGITGKLLKDGVGISYGSGGAVEFGKLARFNSTGGLVGGSLVGGIGLQGLGDPGVQGNSAFGTALYGNVTGAGGRPLQLTHVGGSGYFISCWAGGADNVLTVGMDGGLSWPLSTAGRDTTRTSLGLGISLSISYSGGSVPNSTLVLADVHSTAGFTLTAGIWVLRLNVTYDAGATTAGALFTLNGTAVFAVGGLSGLVNYTVDTGDCSSSFVTSFDGGVPVPSSGATSGNEATMVAVIDVTTAGTALLRFRTEENGTAITVTSVSGRATRIG